MGVKAVAKILPKAGPILLAWPKITTRAKIMYKMLMTGTSFSATAPMRLMPPKRITPISAAIATPNTKFSSFRSPSAAGMKASMASFREPTMELTCDILPMPKEAMAAKTQNRMPTHCQCLLRPFLT